MDQRDRRRHRRRRRRGGRRPVGRRVPDRRVPDRLGHVVEHEHQRGARHAGVRAAREPGAVHPNDHVNASQSSNDVFPTAIHLAAAEAIADDLLPALEHLAESLRTQGATSSPTVVKSGRTHLMDATPVTLGQEFGGYAGPDRARPPSASSSAAPRRRAAARRHRRRHRHQRPEGVRPRRDRAAWRERTGLPLDRGAATTSPPRAARDALVEASGPAADRRRGAGQDRQRPALDGLGPPHRPGRDPHPRPAARLVDHAGQGQPGDPRGRHPGGGPGHRQRRRRGLRRHARAPSSSTSSCR